MDDVDQDALSGDLRQAMGQGTPTGEVMWNHEGVLQRLMVKQEPLAATSSRGALDVAPKGVVWVADDGSELGKSLVELLKERGMRVRLVKPRQVDRMNPPERLDGLMVLAPRPGKKARDESYLLNAFKLVKLAAQALREPKALLDAAQKDGLDGKTSKVNFRHKFKPKTKFLVTVSFNGGEFGLHGLHREEAALSGGLSGLAKTMSHEWPEVACKAVDLSADFLTPEMAAASLVDEVFLEGPLEVGMTPEGLCTPVLEHQPLLGMPKLERGGLAEGDFLLVTGGARGVTSHVLIECARFFRPKVLILGRSPRPSPEPDWLVGLLTEAEIKRALFGRDPSKKPLELSSACRQILAEREISKTLTELESLGLSYQYESCDIRDEADVKRLIRSYEKNWGPVRGIIHGAGVIQDRLIEDKTSEQFLQVFETKVTSLFAMTDAIDLSKLRSLILFSSSTARFGRKGQVDYAVANEVLNKLAQYFNQTFQGLKALAIGFGPWDGGMVDEGLKKLFLKEGVGVIPLVEGAQHVVKEMAAPKTESAEVVLLADPTASGPEGEASMVAEANRLAPSKNSSNRSQNTQIKHQDPAALGLSSVIFSKDVSLRSVPVLKDHMIDGKAVLPVALVMEWLAEACASLPEGDEHMAEFGPWGAYVIEQLTVLDGVKLLEDESIQLEFVVTSVIDAAGEKPDSIEGSGEAAGRGFGPNGPSRSKALVEVFRKDPRSHQRLHGGLPLLSQSDLHSDSHAHSKLKRPCYRGFVAPRSMKTLRPTIEAHHDLYHKSSSEIYRDALFHGPMLQGIQKVTGVSQHGMTAHVVNDALPGQWLESGSQDRWLGAPLALDCAFQLLVMWSQDYWQAPALPMSVGSYQQFVAEFPQDLLEVRIRIGACKSPRLLADIEFVDSDGHLVAQIKGFEGIKTRPMSFLEQGQTKPNELSLS